MTKLYSSWTIVKWKSFRGMRIRFIIVWFMDCLYDKTASVVMVSVLASSAVDREFKTRSGQDY